MPSELLIALGAGLGGMFGWGLADFFAKKTIDQIGDTITLAWGHVFGTIALAVFMMARGQRILLPENMRTWLFLAFFGVLQAVVYLLVYRGFGKGQVGILSAVFASFSGLTAFVSLVFLDEAASKLVLVGLSVLFSGILLINVDIRAFRSRRLRFLHVPGFKEVGIATLLAVVWTLLWDRFVGDRDGLTNVLFMYGFMTIAILTYVWYTRLRLVITTASPWLFLVLIGVCEVAAYVAITIGYSDTSLTSIVAVLSGAFSLPTIVLARLFLREKISALQTVGSLVVIVGIMLLAAQS